MRVAHEENPALSGQGVGGFDAVGRVVVAGYGDNCRLPLLANA